MLIKTLPVGHLETNCYIVTDENTLECAIIDPGAESNTILDYIEDNSLLPKAIFITHGHFDHTTALPIVREATGAPVYVHKNDTCAPGIHNMHRLVGDDSYNYWSDGDCVTVGGMTFTVMETPGHSPGSVVLRCGSALFTGDTLFRDSCGRTDLEGGDMGQILLSLLRIADLDGNFEVYPGHGDSSTLERERSFNYYIRYAREALQNNEA